MEVIVFGIYYIRRIIAINYFGIVLWKLELQLRNW